MEFEEQKSEFYQLVSPSHPNEWEVEEALEILAGVDMVERRALLSHVPAVWPVSHSLCFSYLSEGVRGVSVFPQELLSEWVRQILFRYEEGGLRSARKFMADIEKNFLDPLRGRAGVSFGEILNRMLPYIRGISGLPFSLAVDAEGRLWTDTRTIYVPAVLRFFPKREENMLFYKLLLTIQWAFIAVGTFSAEPQAADFTLVQKRYAARAGGERIEDYLACYPDPALAERLFLLLQFERAFLLLCREFPGLIRQSLPLCLRFLERYQRAGSTREGITIERLHAIFTAAPKKADVMRLDEGLQKIGDFERLPDLFDEFCCYPDDGGGDVLPTLLGVLDFPAARKKLEQVRAEEKERFVAKISVVPETGADASQGQDEMRAEVGEGDAAVVLLGHRKPGKQERTQKPSLSLNTERAQSLADTSAIEREAGNSGETPIGSARATAGITGRGRTVGNPPSQDAGASLPHAPFVYDEWDYRRVGYRKGWCSLTEKELPLVSSTFVPLTLQKYRGVITRVRRQFEMLRTTDRFVRGRRHGGDLDFDAIVEALGDQRAGFAPSDRLFIQLLRDQRDIAAVFLVDMSNSTEGWVGKLIKEALVLLCEVMEVTGDRYGIYGFSGMRRSRCELFHIKHIDEVYGEEVRQRVGAIGPREYTRMGPPIRHLTRLLRGMDARMRLLITLTDGKPEDYDGYNDDYAIEDTRKALIEARGEGIHAFCLTVDQKAHEYLEHMYGRGNYIFVNKIENLPLRMTEFYRLLTS
jgi:nitric oxide reductase NorD protein